VAGMIRSFMTYTVSHIAKLIKATGPIRSDDTIIHLLTDSRRIYSPADSLFFALKGPARNGHRFIYEAYNLGVRSFVVNEDIEIDKYPDANFLLVKDTLVALQELAAFHRSQFTMPVIGITGSNGKTIVKEWLYQLLQEDKAIVRSPRSYNSQIGVPLSVWLMNEKQDLGIFEAGISRPGEMEKLERIIRPTVGVLTNIGEAHSEGFSSAIEKEKEKRILFKNAEEPAPLKILGVKRSGNRTVITAEQLDSSIGSIEIPFTDDASIQNAITCWQVMQKLGYKNKVIHERMKRLAPVNMRLEQKKGINNCTLINDSYSADLDSLDIALNFVEQQTSGQKRTVILSDFLQSALTGEELYRAILEKLEKHRIRRLIAIGPQITYWVKQFAPGIEIELFESTDSFINNFLSSHFKEENILVKGARVFSFEKIVQLLELKAHQTVLEIDLSALAHNLKCYREILTPSTKIMAMVKAFAYGSGGAEIAAILQHHKADYLGVAYADEGVELRKAGIHLPIMVMNAEQNAFEKIVSNSLEPELYSFEMLEEFDRFLQEEGLQQYPVHVEIETGMNRLGFAVGEIERLSQVLTNSTSFKVQSAFTHLAASEEKAQDGFTIRQFELFTNSARELEERLGYHFLKHIANSAAASRFPQMQLDMVRLGIGLYGVESDPEHRLDLKTVATLKTTIAQLKHLKKGETVSYNRRSAVKRDSVIATVRIGYADGYPRRLGNGKGKLLINGQLAPVIGTVCMDMFMADVTDIPSVQEGQDVIIFGPGLPVQQIADWAETIPYEIMTGVSQRVRRVYFEE
jgi:alanine racemase